MKAKTPSGGGHDDKTFEDALKVARMYYHLDLTTADIGLQLGVARPTVSRLLSWARAHGLVEFRVLDHRQRQLRLETQLEHAYGIGEVKVVPAHPDTTVDERQDLVTRFAAHYLNGLLGPGMTLSIAWGATVSRLAQRLIPKPLTGVDVVQLNGSGNSGQGITYAADIIAAFAENYAARAHLLPVPAYFDDPRTKEAMFRERAISRVRELTEQADLALFSIGVPDADSYIYRAGYLERGDLAALQRQGAVGDIATVFFRADGSYLDLAMNQRSSGPDLSTLGARKASVCIVAGEKKAAAIRAALKGGFMNTLLVDEPTARLLLPDGAER
jgi:DNA-binding transcriptional regulator LsrR (DeoR family)